MSSSGARDVQRVPCLFRSLALGALCIPHVSIFAQAPAARTNAWLFTYSVTSSSDGRPLPGGDLLLEVAIWAGRARIRVRQGALKAMTGEGGTILIRTDDSTMAMVNPVTREVLTVATGEFGALMGGPVGAAPLEVSDVTSVTRDRGLDVRLLGYSTRRVELTQGYTLRLNTPVAQRSLRIDQQLQLDVSRDIGRLDSGFRAFAEQFGRSLAVPESVRRKLRESERAVPAGFPIRSVTTAVTVSGSDTLRTTTRAEMTALRREAVDTTTFAIPAGFRITEMSRLLQRPRRP